MTPALPTEQPGETEARDGWSGTGGVGQLQGVLPHAARGTGSPAPSRQPAAARAGGMVAGAGRSGRAPRPGAGGLAPSLRRQAAPALGRWPAPGRGTQPPLALPALRGQSCPFDSTMPARGSGPQQDSQPGSALLQNGKKGVVVSLLWAGLGAGREAKAPGLAVCSATAEPCHGCGSAGGDFGHQGAAGRGAHWQS